MVGLRAYEDGFKVLELSRKHYREVGLDVGELDAMVRRLSCRGKCE